MTAPKLPGSLVGPGFQIPWRMMLPLVYPTGCIPLEDIAEPFLGLSVRHAKERAAAATLDLPAFRLGSQKSAWHVRIEDFVELVEARSADARLRWEAATGGREAA